MEIHAQRATKLVKEDTLPHVSRKIEQSLFSCDITTMKKPKKFNIPYFKIFDGTRNPG